MGGQTPNRAAAIRAAVRALVAEEGFHGASMSKVASRAGVAAGTAYVHYASKDEIVLAAYREAKQALGEAAIAAVADPSTLQERFVQLWLGAYRHLVAEPQTARFLVQVDASPYAAAAHAHAAGRADALMAELASSGLSGMLADLPDAALYELGLGPAVRLAAQAVELTPEQQRLVATACWQAVTSPGPDS